MYQLLQFQQFRKVAYYNVTHTFLGGLLES